MARLRHLGFRSQYIRSIVLCFPWCEFGARRFSASSNQSGFYFSAVMTAAAKLPAHVVAQASKSSPNLLHEIFYGIGLGIFGASFWKAHHMNERRKTEEFYARLEKGEITTVVPEE